MMKRSSLLPLALAAISAVAIVAPSCHAFTTSFAPRTATCINTRTTAFNSLASNSNSNRFNRISTSTITTTSQSSSSTALSALPLPKLAVLGATISRFYKAFPLLAGFLTTSTKACFADSLAQYRDVCTTKFNFKRNLAMILYSGITLGLGCELMYNHLFPIMFPPIPAAAAAAGGNAAIIRAVKCTLFDGFVNAPLLWLPPAYIAQAVVYQYPKREAIQKYITDVKENGLLKKYWSLWLPVSMFNFTIVPPHFRIAFVAAVSFFWMIILSIVANNGDGDVESCPAEPEPAMLNPRALD